MERGELGTVYLVRLIAHDHEPPPDDYIPARGGLFRDSSIHDFDALRWVTGVEVEEVYAVGSVRGFPIFAKYDDVDTGGGHPALTDGTLGVLSQTRHDPLGYDIRMEVVGSRDSVAMGLGPRTPIRSAGAGRRSAPRTAWTTFLTRFEAAYRAELLAFLRVVRGEIPSPCSARDASEAMRIAIAAGPIPGRAPAGPPGRRRLGRGARPGDPSTAERPTISGPAGPVPDRRSANRATAPDVSSHRSQPARQAGSGTSQPMRGTLPAAGPPSPQG